MRAGGKQHGALLGARDSCGILKVEWQLNEGRRVSVLVNLGLI
jgi:hypothetical protein